MPRDRRRWIDDTPRIREDEGLSPKGFFAVVGEPSKGRAARKPHPKSNRNQQGASS